MLYIFRHINCSRCSLKWSHGFIIFGFSLLIACSVVITWRFNFWAEIIQFLFLLSFIDNRGKWFKLIIDLLQNSVSIWFISIIISESSPPIYLLLTLNKLWWKRWILFIFDFFDSGQNKLIHFYRSAQRIQRISPDSY